EDPDQLGIILVESTTKPARRPYHKQKLALIVANQRHFALEQAARGVAVRYIATDAPYRDALASVIPELGPLQAMRPAERELRVDLRPLVDDGRLEYIDHEGWLTTTQQWSDSQGEGTPPWRMDAFYRYVRRATGILMDGDRPRGGKFSFDVENRRAWNGEPAAPEPPGFPITDIKREVAELITNRFAHHPGRLDIEALPATIEDAEALWEWAIANCLPNFGPYQDAMSSGSAGLFHTRVSMLINLSRLLPVDIVGDALRAEIPLAGLEGFVRQILGWREFVRHVHESTDGFRQSPDSEVVVRSAMSDGGYARWAGAPWPARREPPEIDGGATPSYLGAERPLPVAFWTRTSGLACLDRVVAEVWDTGYGHHIQRLMILANIATLLDCEPRELTDWFWVAFADAFDWVVEPNVLGMGSFAVGDLMTTKPYVSGAAYIDRMSDYCDGCRFHPARDCPITNLYWAFLDRHFSKLRNNPRLRLPLASLRKRSREKRRNDAAVFRHVSQTLAEGDQLSPDALPGQDSVDA
ncbi:MAG: cryptochrome/photolyase family protein, partial [Gemmatimonadales bacterium]